MSGLFCFFAMNEDKIFLGNTATSTRTYLQSAFRILKEKSYYKRLVIPCCGQLSVAMAALQAGWDPEQMYTSDVSLFSTVLARSIKGEAMDDLGIKVDGKPYDGNYAELMYWIRYYTALYQCRHYYQRVIVKDLKDRKAAHIQIIQEGLDKFEVFRGMKYRTYDLFDEVAEAIGEPGTVIWCNPPFYKRGYERMFDTGGKITWNEPEFKLFVPDRDHCLLRDGAIGKPALFLWSRYTELDPGDGPYAVFAEQKGAARWDYTLCNRPEELNLHSVAKKPQDVSKKLAIIPAEYEIKPTSVIGFKSVTSDEALYYRDLFIHRLGVTRCKYNFMMVIDEQVAGVVGFTAIEKIQRDAFDAHSEEAYGITAPSLRHPKINKLMIMLIRSDEFLRRHIDTLQFRSLGVITTFLSPYPEMKANRGVYKLISKKEMPDGTFKLRYQADRTTQSYKEVLDEWLTKYS